jgi:Ca2+/H+ antiporter, TMEM165/GDT1 family
MANMIAYDARSLLFGLALVFAGVPMLLTVKKGEIKRFASPLAASLFGFGRVQFGDASQFIVFAVAARSTEPILAVLGGALGIIAATTPAIVLQADWPGKLPLKPIRMVAAVVLTLAGAVAALSALKLI